MMSVYKAARISKPDACMAALPGTPGTMASMRDLKPWQNTTVLGSGQHTWAAVPGTALDQPW